MAKKNTVSKIGDVTVKPKTNLIKSVEVSPKRKPLKELPKKFKTEHGTLHRVVIAPGDTIWMGKKTFNKYNVNGKWKME